MPTHADASDYLNIPDESLAIDLELLNLTSDWEQANGDSQEQVKQGKFPTSYDS